MIKLILITLILSIGSLSNMAFANTGCFKDVQTDQCIDFSMNNIQWMELISFPTEYQWTQNRIFGVNIDFSMNDIKALQLINWHPYDIIVFATHIQPSAIFNVPTDISNILNNLAVYVLYEKSTMNTSESSISYDYTTNSGANSYENYGISKLFIMNTRKVNASEINSLIEQAIWRMENVIKVSKFMLFSEKR